jgi:hypothetical protein
MWHVMHVAPVFGGYSATKKKLPGSWKHMETKHPSRFWELAPHQSDPAVVTNRL